MNFQPITLFAIALALALPAFTFPLLNLPVITLPVVTLPVLTPPVLKRALTLPVLTPPVITLPVLHPPVLKRALTLPVITLPVITLPVLHPPVLKRALTLPVLTPPVITLPVLTSPVLIPSVLKAPVRKRVLKLPVVTPPVITLPVLTPPVLTKKAQVPVTLGTASTFGVLGASTATSTGNTVITGDIGVFPGSSITGFPPGQYTGNRYNAGAIAGKAQQDSTTAYNTAAGLAPTTALTSSDLGGLTLPPGVYTFPTPIVELTTNLTLDAGLDSTAQFVFQIEKTFDTAALAKVLLVNGALPCNIIWVVGVSATLATQTAFQGILLAAQAITVKAGVSNVGSLIALNAAVTLIDNNLKSGSCISGGGGAGGGGGGGTTPTTSSIPSATSKLLSISASLVLIPK